MHFYKPQHFCFNIVEKYFEIKKTLFEIQNRMLFMKDTLGFHVTVHSLTQSHLFLSNCIYPRARQGLAHCLL